MLALQNIAIANPEGFTVDAKTLKPVGSGYAVACVETQNSFNVNGLANVVKFVSEHSEINAFGGWYNKENDRFYFDATMIINDREKAIEIGRMNKQIAIFDLNNPEKNIL